MTRSFAIKGLLLGSVALAGVGFSGCGGSEPPQPSAASLQENAKQTQANMDFMKEQYKNKTATPSK